MKTQKKSFWSKLYRWRLRHVTDKQLMYALSLLLGITSGLAAVVLKSMVHGIQYLLHLWAPTSGENFLYFFLPIIGITLTLFVIKYVIKSDSNIGVPGVLYAISRKKLGIGFYKLSTNWNVGKSKVGKLCFVLISFFIQCR